MKNKETAFLVAYAYEKGSGSMTIISHKGDEFLNPFDKEVKEEIKRIIYNGDENIKKYVVTNVCRIK
jgi:pyruvate/2-oxoglutarate dehydrogenase complex dihydrolipoamide dehydrogenase (E3) component